jgi:glycosyltransferase involved in cell wall biosynthesis
MLNIGRISVVVPVYNTQEYFARCFQSLTAQTYPDLEIILVNDGSTDDSGNLCDEAAQIDQRVRVIHQGNRGLSAARNVGLDHSQCDYVTFLDSDDWLDPDCLRILADEILGNNADVSMCRLARVHGEDDAVPVTGPWVQSFMRIDGLMYIDRNLSGLMAVSCGKLFKKALFSGIRFPEGRYHEDEFTTYRLLYEAERMVIINRMLYYHRIRAASITQKTLTFARAKDAIEALLERGCFFQDQHLPLLAGSAHRYMFHLYREYTQKLKDQLSPAEAKSWGDLGQKVHEVLKKGAASLRFKMAYETFFRIMRK